MRIRVTLIPPETGLCLPIHYNRALQGVIYMNLDRDTAKLFHDEGFDCGGRRFKMFTFSRLLCRSFRVMPEAGRVVFRAATHLIVSSPSRRFCTSLLLSLLSRGAVEVAGQQVAVSDVREVDATVTEDTVMARSLSPVVTYATLPSAGAARYTRYYEPGEPEFERLLARNLARKCAIVSGRVDTTGEAGVTVRTDGATRLHVVRYEGTVIKGYSGRFRMTGPAHMLQVAVDAGLGAKNSQGFGCIEVEREREGESDGEDRRQGVTGAQNG